MSGEKTEKPTKKKLEDAREKGQVAVSKDIQIVAKICSFYAVFFWMAPDYSGKFSVYLELLTSSSFGANQRLDPAVFWGGLDLFFQILAPLVVACIAAGTVMTWLQIGFLVAPEAALPSFKKLDPVSNLKNIFSKKSFIHILLSVLKVAILTWVAYKVFLTEVPNIVESYRGGLAGVFQVLARSLKTIVFYSLGLFVVVALLDWASEYFNYIKNNKMSKHDIKDENKQTQGDPKTKSRRRKEHRSILNSSLNRLGEAKAVVANPTHISVALDYEPGKHDIPYILCMGVDEDAFLIRKKARELGVPVIVNVALARGLYQDCEEDEYIKKEHLALAAEVFKAVMRLAKTPQ